MIAAEARTATTETDEQLVRRVADGDVRAFEALYHRHHRDAYRLARRVLGGAGGAAAATQEAFISLWRGAGTFDAERASFRTWLHTLVRYRSIDLLRRETHRARRQEPTQDALMRLEAPERTEEQVLAIQGYDSALRLVTELPPEQREVIGLAYLRGYTQTEIATSVGVPLGTVKGRTRLGLLKLRHAVERESNSVPGG